MFIARPRAERATGPSCLGCSARWARCGEMWGDVGRYGEMAAPQDGRDGRGRRTTRDDLRGPEMDPRGPEMDPRGPERAREGPRGPERTREDPRGPEVGAPRPCLRHPRARVCAGASTSPRPTFRRTRAAPVRPTWLRGCERTCQPRFGAAAATRHRWASRRRPARTARGWLGGWRHTATWTTHSGRGSTTTRGVDRDA